jgi:hypothetical protein
MKKNYLLYFVLGLLLLNVAVACGGENEPDPEEPTEENDSGSSTSGYAEPEWIHSPDEGYCGGPYMALIKSPTDSPYDTIWAYILNFEENWDSRPHRQDYVFFNRHDLNLERAPFDSVICFYVTALKPRAWIGSVKYYTCILKPLNEGETKESINWRY